MTSSPPRTPDDYVGGRIREVRRTRQWSTTELAERCAAMGAPHLTAPVINDIETGRSKAGARRRPVSVSELLAFALALNAPPVYLIVPPDDLDEPYPVTPAASETRRNVAAWIRGTGPMLPRMPLVGDVRKFYAELPEEEFQAMTQRKEPE